MASSPSIRTTQCRSTKRRSSSVHTVAGAIGSKGHSPASSRTSVVVTSCDRATFVTATRTSPACLRRSRACPIARIIAQQRVPSHDSGSSTPHIESSWPGAERVRNPAGRRYPAWQSRVDIPGEGEEILVTLVGSVAPDALVVREAIAEDMQTRERTLHGSKLRSGACGKPVARFGHSPVSFLVMRKRQNPKLSSLIVCPSLTRLPSAFTRSRDIR